MTQLYLLLGNPVSHSISPYFWNETFKKIGMDAAYFAIKVEEHDIDIALHGIEALGIAGVNITLPYKQVAAKFCKKLYGAAQVTGVVNTLLPGSNGCEGWNTDYSGLKKILNEFVGVKKALVIGSGASSLTAISVLSEMDCKQIYQIARKHSDSEVEEKNGIYLTKIAWNSKHFAYSIKESDIIVNTTPLGWKPEDDIPELVEYLTRAKIYVDFNYSSYSRLLKAAMTKNCRIVDGYELLLKQGLESFGILTGEAPPEEIMRKAVYSCRSEY